MKNTNSFNSEDTIEINDQKFKYFNLNKAAEYFDTDLSKIPITIKIIIENLLRNEDGENINKDMIFKVFNSLKQINDKRKKIEIAFFPTRVLMQDFTGVPAVADLAAMRNSLKSRGIEPKKIHHHKSPLTLIYIQSFFNFLFSVIPLLIPLLLISK